MVWAAAMNAHPSFALRHFVIVASIGRAELLAQTVARLADQTRPPDGVVVVSVTPEDVAGLDDIRGLPLEILFSPKGLPIQRNAGLRHVAGRADIVTFFDDDFLPAADYLETLGVIFASRPDVVGATGRLIADGIGCGGYALDEALALLEADRAPEAPGERLMPALYGCNMSFRLASAEGLQFDEALPLYGWQEDVDYSYQVGKRGLLVRSDLLAGVHMGAAGGRTSGKRLGYSQIANPVYLLRKGTIPRKLAWRLMRRNVAANLLGTLRFDPNVDRPGRLLGNLLAMRDVVKGQIHPTRILELTSPAAPPARAGKAANDAARAAVRDDSRAGLVNGSVGFLSRAFSQLALLAVTVIATRHLTTAEFGAFAIASAFLFLTRNLFYVGPYEFLLKSRPSDTVAGSCLIANGLIAVAGCVGFAAISGISEALFGTADIGMLLRWLLPSLLLAAATSWHEAVMLRGRRVNLYYGFNLFADFAGAAVAIACLALGYGLLALVAQVYVRLGVLLLLFVAERGTLALPPSSKADVRAVFEWSRSRYGSAFLNFGSGYGADIMLGILLSPAATGLYRAANRIVFALSDLFIQPLLKIAQTNVSARVAAGIGPGTDWLRMFSAVAAAAWAALAILSLAAHDIVPFVLGPQWDAAAPLVIIFCVARAFGVMDAVTTPVLVATDQQHFMLRAQITMATLVIGGSALLASSGPMAVAIFVCTLSAGLTVYYGRRALRLSDARRAEFWGALVVAAVPLLLVLAVALLLHALAVPVPALLRIGLLCTAALLGLVLVRRPLASALAALGGARLAPAGAA